MYLLDTSLCILIIRKAPSKLLKRLDDCDPEQVGLSAVTLSELTYGVSASAATPKNREALELFLSAFQVIDYGAQAALAYGHVRQALAEKNVAIGAMDLMIAAHALALGATLVSSEPKPFRAVPGLVVENWAR
jgi:tRNA(fMet)-specific endonuclease VapC